MALLITECRNLSGDPAEASRVAQWRARLVRELADRPEGFVEGDRLVSGRPYGALLPQHTA